MTGTEQIARFGQPISGNFPQEGIAFANFLCKDTGTDEEKEPKRIVCLVFFIIFIIISTLLGVIQ